MSTKITSAAPAVSLEVAYVGNGGNTGGGKYFYSFNPDPIQVVESGVEMVFALSDSTSPTIKIVDFTSSDALGQLTGITINKIDQRSVTFTNKNTVPYLIQVAVVVSDSDSKHENANVICDPQIINTPVPP